MERDYHELKCDFDMFKKRSERAGLELENTNKKLNTQIHSGRKEIALLKEVCKAEVFDCVCVCVCTCVSVSACVTIVCLFDCWYKCVCVLFVF